MIAQEASQLAQLVRAFEVQSEKTQLQFEELKEGQRELRAGQETSVRDRDAMRIDIKGMKQQTDLIASIITTMTFGKRFFLWVGGAAILVWESGQWFLDHIVPIFPKK